MGGRIKSLQNQWEIHWFVQSELYPFFLRVPKIMKAMELASLILGVICQTDLFVFGR
jgi:hypothetical protein